MGSESRHLAGCGVDENDIRVFQVGGEKISPFELNLLPKSTGCDSQPDQRALHGSDLDADGSRAEFLRGDQQDSPIPRPEIVQNFVRLEVRQLQRRANAIWIRRA